MECIFLKFLRNHFILIIHERGPDSVITYITYCIAFKARKLELLDIFELPPSAMETEL